MSYNTKNRTEQGGGKTVIGGELEILSGATIIADEGATVEGFGGTPLLPAIDFNDVTYESGTGFVYNGAALEEGLYQHSGDTIDTGSSFIYSGAFMAVQNGIVKTIQCRTPVTTMANVAYLETHNMTTWSEVIFTAQS